jgi:thimet oligopeptidase
MPDIDAKIAKPAPLGYDSRREKGSLIMKSFRHLVLAPLAFLLAVNASAATVSERCESEVTRLNKRLSEIVSVRPEHRTLRNTLFAFENALADFGDATNELTFNKYVSLDKDLRKQGSDCEEQVSVLLVGVFTRRDLYDALRAVEPLESQERRLWSKTLEGFEQNGLSLPDEELAKVKERLEKIASLEAKFSENLNEDTAEVVFTADELAGVISLWILKGCKPGKPC